MPSRLSTNRYQENALECAKLLIQRGDVYQLDRVGIYTPLIMAAFRGPTHLPMVKLLLENGADTHVKNRMGKTVYDSVRGSPVLAEALRRLEASMAMPPVTLSLSELKALPVHELKSILNERGLTAPSGLEKGEFAAYILEKAGKKNASSTSEDVPAVPASRAISSRGVSSSLPVVWHTGPRMKLCGGCESVWLCSTDCQRSSWPGHRAECKKRAEEKRKVVPKSD